MDSEPIHSLLGASSAKRFLACGASYYLEKTLKPENTSSEFAEKGTRAHEIAEICLKKNKATFEFKGSALAEDISLGNIDIYVSYVRYLTHILNGTLLVEQKLKINSLIRGTVDAIVYNKDEVHIIDLKAGEGVLVDVEENEQLMYYAFMAIYLIKDIAKLGNVKVVLTIAQPNIDTGFPIRHWVTTSDTIMSWARKVLVPRINYLSKMQPPKPEDYVNGEHCRFCKVILDCPLIKWAVNRYKDFNILKVGDMTREELDYLYTFLPNIKTFCTRMEEEIEARMFRGEAFNNVKLVRRKSFREWKEGAQEALIKAYGTGVIEYKLKSPAAIEKEYAGGKQITASFAFTPITENVTIAPMSDKREAITPKRMADRFANINF